ncbi:MAG: TadE/TadG family type IV pilus assembly protein, partial [Pseudonocardiaceae bacterium]
MRRRALRSDSGAAAVEFALVSVLLFTLLFGTVQYGYFFFQATAAEHAAREGAREA